MEDPDILVDLRHRNVNGSDKYGVFWAKCKSFLDECIAVQERRHDTVCTYMAKAISVRDLVEQVSKLCPDGSPKTRRSNSAPPQALLGAYTYLLMTHADDIIQDQPFSCLVMCVSREGLCQVYQLTIEGCHLNIVLFYEVSTFGQIAGVFKLLFTSESITLTTKTNHTS